MSSGAAAATRPRFATERGTLRLFRGGGTRTERGTGKHRQGGAALPRTCLALAGAAGAVLPAGGRLLRAEAQRLMP